MRVLLVGYGKMGHVHAKYLQEAGLPWDYFDPNVQGGLPTLDATGFTHAIIATPMHTHADIIRQLPGIPLLVEKPVVTCWDDLPLIDTPGLFCGMVERFNPAVARLRTRQPEEISFTRRWQTFQEDLFLDLAIHDLDLCCYLLGKPEITDVGDDWATGRVGETIARFDWREGARARFVTLDGERCDLLGGEPVRAEHNAFFAGCSLNAKPGHAVCLKLCSNSGHACSVTSTVS